MSFSELFGLERGNKPPTVEEHFLDFKANLSRVVSRINRAYADIGVSHHSGSGDNPPDGMETAHKEIDVSKIRKELGALNIEWIALKSDLIASQKFKSIDDQTERNGLDNDFIIASEHLAKLEEEQKMPKDAFPEQHAA